MKIKCRHCGAEIPPRKVKAFIYKVRYLKKTQKRRPAGPFCTVSCKAQWQSEQRNDLWKIAAVELGLDKEPKGLSDGQG